MKKCTKCFQELEISSFAKDITKQDKLRPSCKECNKEIYKQYYINNREKLLNYAKTESYKIKKRIYMQKHAQENKGKRNEYLRQYYINNQEKIQEYYANKRLDPEYRLRRQNYNKKYVQKNREQINARYSQWLKSDINHRIYHNISTNLNKTINKKQKTSKYLELFGYNLEDLKNHLTKQFQDGMSWENYGEWHIDHKIPRTWFDLSNEDELKYCYSLQNLQPLWQSQNSSKGNRYADIHSKKTPSQLKKAGREQGLKSKNCTSGKEVLRHIAPAVACSMSLADDIILHGNTLSQAYEITKDTLPIYAKLLKLGIDINELKK